MKSTVVLGVLVAFALVNTAFLGLYLFSTQGSPVYGPAGQSNVATTTQVQDAAGSSQTLAVASASPGNTTSAPTSNTTNGGTTYAVSGTSGPGTTSSPSPLRTLTQFFENHSLVLAPTSWFFVGGMWIWRGRMKSKWTNLGFDSDVFGLFVRMKGAKTRIRLLDALSVPKDRLQLAQELGLDWKAVNRHVSILKKYGFLEERVAYGKVRLYALTPMGSSLLHLLDDLSREDRRDQGQLAPAVQEPI